MTVILFGGTFDPVHLGHLHIAKSVLPFADKVIFVPCKANPLGKEPQASAEHRVGMLEIATSDEPRFEISDIELKRKGKSYTIDTVKAFYKKEKEKVGLLVGYDTFLTWNEWKEPEEILKYAKLFVSHRPGVPVETVEAFLHQPVFKEADIQIVRENSFNISSTQVKIYCYLKEDISVFTPPGVAEYISSHHLYVRSDT